MKMSQYPQEEKREDSVKLLKSAIEAKINQLIQINNRLRLKLAGLHSVFGLSQQLNSVFSLNSILENTLLTCLEQFRVKGALIRVQSDLSDRAFSISKNKGMEIENNRELSLDSELAHYLKVKNNPVFRNEVECELKYASKAGKPGRGLKPEIIVPLVIGDNLRGVLMLSSKVSDISFTEDDLEFVSLLANQVAVAVEISLLNQNRKNSDVELKKAKQLLTQAEKLAGMNQLSVMIAREINNPLGIIKNYLTLITRSLKKTDKSHSHLKMISEEVDRMARIIKQFLDFNRPKSEVKTLIDVEFLLEDTLTYVEEQFFTEKVYIKTDFLKNLPKIKVFPEELKEAFLNILKNCKNSMPHGGEIEVSSRREQDKLKIEFKNTGSRINEKDLSQIFKPFCTASHDGLGMGLWVSKDIIKRHKGELKVKNRDDRKGVCYNINLPLAPQYEKEIY